MCVCVSVAPKLAMYNLDLLDIFLSESCVGRMSFNKLQSTMKFLHHTQLSKNQIPNFQKITFARAILFIENRCLVPLKFASKGRS